METVGCGLPRRGAGVGRAGLPHRAHQGVPGPSRAGGTWTRARRRAPTPDTAQAHGRRPQHPRPLPAAYEEPAPCQAMNRRYFTSTPRTAVLHPWEAIAHVHTAGTRTPGLRAHLEPLDAARGPRAGKAGSAAAPAPPPARPRASQAHADRATRQGAPSPY